MNWRAIAAITHKDLRIVLQNQAVVLPALAVPLLILIGLPVALTQFPTLQSIPGTLLAGVDDYLGHMPAGLQVELAGYNPSQMVIVAVLLYLIAPLYLIMPLMVASTIAADSFAGEKERKTIEALLHSPMTDRELFLSKLLSAWLPALVVAWGGAVIYGLVANVVSFPIVGSVLFPNAMWTILVLWVAPAVAGLGLSVMVLVSARSRSFQDAYQMGTAVVIPLVMVFIGQATGAFYMDVRFTALLGLIIWLVDGVLLWLGAYGFQRLRVARSL